MGYGYALPTFSYLFSVFASIVSLSCVLLKMWLDRCIYEYKVVPLMTGALDITYYYAMTYAMFFQFFTNVAIACNRFTAISFPAQHANVSNIII